MELESTIVKKPYHLHTYLYLSLTIRLFMAHFLTLFFNT